MAAKAKLHGRAFYESIGSPRYVVAPMVDQSEFAWRMLTRSFLPPDLRASVLAYSPMFHAKLFADSSKYRTSHFEPVKPPLTIPQPSDAHHAQTVETEDAYLDGNPKIDRPLFVQFCANEPDLLLEAAKFVQPYCDAVDLNLGCPQGIARRGHYGAFLQEDWDTIYKLINILHENLDIPVTAKMRILETKEKTLEYAKMILSAGASIITVHGRQREQKGHNTGLADWTVLRYLRENLPSETVMFANGNILQHADLQQCLDETQADGVMTAEGNLYDPSIFSAGPPVGDEGREYWRGRSGKGGYRADAVLRRYLDIIHRHVLGHEPPHRKPLPLPSDEPVATAAPLPAHRDVSSTSGPQKRENDDSEPRQPPSKKQKRAERSNAGGGKSEKCTNPNLTAMQAHCFHILRSLVGDHHDVRDALARCRPGDIPAYEHVLELTEAAVLRGLQEYAANPSKFDEENEEADEGVKAADSSNQDPNGEHSATAKHENNNNNTNDYNNSSSSKADDTADANPASASSPPLSSTPAIRRCRRPFWVCQPHIRPLPHEALAKGSLSLSKKEKARLEQAREKEAVGLPANGGVETVVAPSAAGAAGAAAAADTDAAAAAPTETALATASAPGTAVKEKAVNVKVTEEAASTGSGDQQQQQQQRIEVPKDGLVCG